ncbi:MAG: hypothetical protein EA396_04045 [Anaerolineaceae bacterium]|nr:MAG: hypothetical protein EA396_04045 [Anaerolineaceae bacterium]
MKIRFILLTSLLTLLVVACAPEVRIVSDDFLRDTSLISDEPCGAPCWRGITPGETRWNDALEIVENDETLTSLQTRSDADTGQIGAAWAQVDGDNCCQMFTQDGETVSLLVTQTTPEVTFGQVVEKFGEPDYLLGEVVSSDQALLSVYYTDVPMLIYLFVEGQNGQIAESNPVVGFAYTTPDLMELVIDTSNLYLWRGFGDFSAFTDGEFDLTPSITLTPIN